METRKIRLSVGECTVKGASSSDVTDQEAYSRLKCEPIDKKIEVAKTDVEKDALLWEKSQLIRNMYNNFLASLIVEHDFNLDGSSLGEYLGNLSRDETDFINTVSSEISSISKEEMRDLSQPSEGKEELDTGVTRDSLKTSTSLESITSDGTYKT